ncbi:hypothetical protein [Leucobacter tenebrionis]|uniref:hypothetical protein n=1 Tax=Leucobacter tenebrionis TaxID=2873270 RepID=UPI001CA63A9D|nr:hypothetical protein [Leucobacter tenebrionis]QZY52907.1 hypothetical protein KVY00_05590 [Leucobacter tenebrionis]
MSTTPETPEATRRREKVQMMKRNLAWELGTGIRGLAGLLLISIVIRWQPEDGFWNNVLWSGMLIAALELLVVSVLRDREKREHRTSRSVHRHLRGGSNVR